MGAKPGPYRKPTQVGEASSLRCTGEPWRRNSAKSSRNFGIRDARASGPQQRGPSDCLTKTQDDANPQGDVCRLTRARCRKVNRRSQPQGEALNRSPGKRRP